MDRRVFQFLTCFAGMLLCLVAGIAAQNTPASGRHILKITIAQQPDAPIRVTADAVFCRSAFKCPISQDDSYPEPIINISLKLENVSGSAVVGYALVSKGKGFQNVQVNALVKPLFPGESFPRGFGTGGSEELFYTLDYVIFADGRSWGADSLQRSKQLALYLEGRRDALAKLTELSAAYPEPGYFIDRVKGFGFISHDTATRPTRERLTVQYHLGWMHIVQRLRESPKRTNDANKLADLLEAAIPNQR